MCHQSLGRINKDGPVLKKDGCSRPGRERRGVLLQRVRSREAAASLSTVWTAEHELGTLHLRELQQL